MPVSGFKTITVTEQIYGKYEKWWIENKSKYQEQGVNSFSGFLTSKLSEAHKQITLKTRFVQLHSHVLPAHSIILKDDWKDEIIELGFFNGELICKACGKNSCMHVGFCYSLPQNHKLKVSIN